MYTLSLLIIIKRQNMLRYISWARIAQQKEYRDLGGDEIEPA